MVINRQAAFTLLENSYLREMLKELNDQKNALVMELAEAQEQLDMLNSDGFIATHRRQMEY